MKAVVLKAFGLDQLDIEQRTQSEPGPGQLLLEMKVASLNYRDLMVVRGEYNPRQRMPLVPCSDGVGVVLAVGSDVEGFSPGERVCPIFAQRWLAGPLTADAQKSTLGSPLDGVLSQRMLVDATAVVRPPAHLSDTEAACLPCAAVTAWNALVAHGSLQAGDTLLTLGTGGVSLFALQFAKLRGARVIVTSSSDAKLERTRGLGADETVNYRKQPEWGRAVQELTGKRGVDHVIEVGGAGTFEQSLRAVRTAGRISLIGVLAGGAARVDLTPILMRNITVQGILVGPRSVFQDMCTAIEQTGIRPLVDRTFSMSEARQAFEYLAAGQHFGKVAIQLVD